MRPGDAVIVKYKGEKRHATVLSAATDLMGIHKPRKEAPPPRGIYRGERRKDAGTDSLEDDAAQMPEG